MFQQSWFFLTTGWYKRTVGAERFYSITWFRNSSSHRNIPIRINASISDGGKPVVRYFVDGRFFCAIMYYIYM